mgnify:FL=1
MTELKLAHCKVCNRLEPEAALKDGICCLCRKDRCIERRHRYGLVLVSILAAISTGGLIFCLWGT